MAAELISPSAKPVPPATLKPQAYVTFLAGNGDHMKGVISLAKRLRKVKSSDRLVVAVLPDMLMEHPKTLKDQGCDIRAIEPMYPPENQSQFATTNYVGNYSKIMICELQ